jgi:hypothetical protein
MPIRTSSAGVIDVDGAVRVDEVVEHVMLVDVGCCMMYPNPWRCSDNLGYHYVIAGHFCRGAIGGHRAACVVTAMLRRQSGRWTELTPYEPYVSYLSTTSTSGQAGDPNYS